MPGYGGGGWGGDHAGADMGGSDGSGMGSGLGGSTSGGPIGGRFGPGANRGALGVALDSIGYGGDGRAGVAPGAKNAYSTPPSALAGLLGLSDAQRQGNFNANAARDAHEAAAELSTRGEGEEEGIRRNCLNSGGSWIGDTSSGYCKMPEDVAVTGPTDPGGGGTPKPKPKPKPKPPGGPNPDIKPSPIPGITPTGPADTATILGDTYDYMYNWRPVTPGQGMNPLVDPNAWLHQVDPKWQRIRDPGIYVNPAINVGMMPQQARATNATMSRNPYSLLG